ncbi:DNA cytosine methyltransferase [Streptomyces sp. SID5614]|uniref:DNA cytosine methyltransferase n=1 Tax=Streptomyces sp. SID5614 TaxID=2690306 RepID=UPI0013681651|nr:DNA cytosine methyltransferase [Streptomyces sp. SID5614]MZG03976.1 DNA cytosine methyltransferase [Streptomyces sp. SID5614]
MTTNSPRVLDLFAGPGGWSQGLRALGVREIGLEIDAAACATRRAAGHLTIRTDVATYPTGPLAGRVVGLIGSAPCQPFSSAGLGAGHDDMHLCHQALDDLARGTDTRPLLRTACSDPRSLLVAEPLRYALDLHPEWVALEEVPAAQPLFEHTARILRTRGYSTWVGILNAADHGVPQTRRRAVLMASRTRTATPPEPTHAETAQPETLFGPGRLPWVSMGEAIGCPTGEVTTRGNHTSGGTRFSTTAPAWALTGRARSWTLRVGNRPNATRRTLDRPAPTLLFGHALKNVSWHDDHGTPARQLDAAEAAVLQGFPTDYPWQGSRTKQFEQIGNAVPPPLATAILTGLGVNVTATADLEVAA